ncbi:ABC transporter ATP-binding protein [Hydrogenophaga laconesensis]|uniref:Branched-chain amino acid transport system ATP-binding protein n=1 Tax=Hydrogenophaga laconesensis TaxID=1805971 RepID=A0ABU1VCY0_9BURK|nr:ABC transporter ATP-binding protein [Hydrogenophaga laconesensis]MDR7095341.1 branched-chain amino acid transport system ATP-binding protein [Hydrogenophaga laconesensis]
MDPVSTPAPAPGFLSGHALELHGVSRHFGSLRAIDDVSFCVTAGQRYGVLGSNGAGKTTLFNAITGDFPTTAGRVVLFGEDVTALPPQERVRRGLRRTYQTSLLFRQLSVRDNLFLAVRGVAGGRLSLVRAARGGPSPHAVETLLSMGRLDTIADTLVADLSHGQQRQLEIAMALAGSPRLILFDEPAAGLSPVERRELVALLRGLPRHIGFLIIEHDLDIALTVTEQVTVMHNGRVLVHGTPDEIQANDDVHAIYMGEGRHAHH